MAWVGWQCVLDPVRVHNILGAQALDSKESSLKLGAITNSVTLGKV